MSVGSISSLSINDREENEILFRSTCKWDRGRPNNHLITIISNLMPSMMDEHDGEESRTELDSHENMVVVGNHATIYYNTGNKVGVSSFTPDYQALEKVSIVDAAVQYTCQYMEKVYVLMFRNALVVPSMENNLIPSFVVI